MSLQNQLTSDIDDISSIMFRKVDARRLENGEIFQKLFGIDL